MHFQTEVTIERPREDVFRRLAHELGTTMPLICPLTTSMMLASDKPLAVGAIGQVTVRTPFGSRIVDFTVTGHQELEQLSLKMRYRNRSAQTDYLFRDAGAGTTVTVVSDAPPVGPRWLQGWNHRALERHERHDAQRLKALLEGRQKDPAKAYWRSVARLVLIVWAFAALIGVAFAVYQPLTS